MTLTETEDYQRIFTEDIPLIDVRAPIEFNEGAFPLSVNLPFIDDSERHLIGIKYKQEGQDKAIELGHRLVQGETKKQRIQAWSQFIQDHPDGLLYCFRGGMRSKLSQQWIHEQTDISYPRITGGYKALRQYLIQELEVSANGIPLLIIGGRTGVGKTLFLKNIKNSIDLERLAWHRGSAFGHHATPQPTQINFENSLSIQLLKHRTRSNLPLLVEDEGRHIGSRLIPGSLSKQMQASPILLLKASVEERIEITYQEYIHEALAEHQSQFGDDQGWEAWKNHLLGSLSRIKKRLGGERYAQFNALMNLAFKEHQSTDDTSLHKEWIRLLLTEYYDPMYDYQIDNKKERVVMSGSRDELFNYLVEHHYFI